MLVGVVLFLCVLSHGQSYVRTCMYTSITISVINFGFGDSLPPVPRITLSDLAKSFPGTRPGSFFRNIDS